MDPGAGQGVGEMGDPIEPDHPRPAVPLSVRTQQDSGTTSIVLDGELDVAGGGLLRDAAQRVVSEQPERVLIDLEGLGFIDSSGLRALLEAGNRVRRAGIALITRAPRGHDARLLIEGTGTQDLLRLAF